MVIPAFSFVNNLYNIKIDDITSNAMLNFGNAIHKGYSANAQSVGGQNIIGDISIPRAIEGNLVSDPDLIDQAQVQF